MAHPGSKLPVVVDGLRLTAGACAPERPRALVVLLHGIPSAGAPDPEDMGYPGFAARMADDGYAAAWVDMRGVRGSKGFFSIEGWVRDARACIDAARSLDGVQGLPLGLVGSSAGGAVATEVVRRGAPVDALALLAAPAAWLSFAPDPAEGLRYIVEQAGMPLSPDTIADPTTWAREFETVTTERSIAAVKAPTLILHGSADDVVPVDHAYRLAERAPHADLRILDGVGHQLRRDPRAVEALIGWLDGVLG